MIQGKLSNAVLAAMLLLFGQTIVSALLFSRFPLDGGAWPIIALIFLLVDLGYSSYMARLVKTGGASQSIVVVLTVVLSLLLFFFNNFWLIFGAAEVAAARQFWFVGGLLSSGFSPYAFYLFFMLLATVFGKLQRRENASGMQQLKNPAPPKRS